VEARKTLSDALEQHFQKANVEPSSVIVQAKVGDAFFGFVLPGEKLISVINELWRSSSAGQRFKKALESFIPFADYDYIVIDNAPFFDPRYTALSLHISDCIFIPLRPSLIDLKRTLRMISWLEDEMETVENGEKLRENLYAVFNHVPTNLKQVEKRFVENFLQSKEGEKFSRPDCIRQYDALLTHARQLKSKGVKFMNSYVEVSSDIERFPNPAMRELPKRAEGFIAEASQVLKGLSQKP
jgi:cellulose biosynthesis protein BcsQ